MIIEIPNENSIVKWKHDDKDEWKVAEISDLIQAYEHPQGEWIEIKYRRLTDEEFEQYKDRCGDMPELWREDLRYFDCKIPENGQDVLVTTQFGDVLIDTWYNDGENCYFEYYCDDGDVIAWQPLPKPYKKGSAV